MQVVELAAAKGRGLAELEEALMLQVCPSSPSSLKLLSPAPLLGPGGAWTSSMKQTWALFTCFQDAMRADFLMTQCLRTESNLAC